MTEITKEEAMELLSAKVAEFEKVLAQAEAIADEHGLSFHICPEYGMGGTYEGGEPKSGWYYTHGWNPSSGSC
jgi:hypothetical protein